MNSSHWSMAGLIAGLLLAAGPAGCSRPPPPQIEGVIDACNAIDAVEPVSILGEPLGDVQEMRNDDNAHKVYIRHCYKYSESGRNKQYGVMVQQDLSDRQVGDAAEQVRAIRENAAQHGARVTFEDVNGVGEAAIWNSTMHQLIVIDDEGRTIYRFNVIGVDNEREKAVQLARQALAEQSASSNGQQDASQEG